MTSKPLPTSQANQSRFLHEYYQPIHLSYSQYATVSYHNMSLPYASNAYGVYRRIPAHLKTPPLLHTNLNRRIDLRNRSQQRQLSCTNDDHREINDLINTIDNNQNQNEENSSDTIHHSIVSLPFTIHQKKIKEERILSFSLFLICRKKHFLRVEYVFYSMYQLHKNVTRFCIVDI
jgi:hypothetical protein